MKKNLPLRPFYRVVATKARRLMATRPLKWFVLVTVLVFINLILHIVRHLHVLQHPANAPCNSFEDVQSLPPKNPCLIQYLRDRVLFPPSPLPYNWSTVPRRKDPSQYPTQVRDLLGNKTGGFFIEAGANDGIFYSNTFRLERDLNWTGLLIEPHPTIGKQLLTKNRKAWFAHGCISPYNNASRIMMAMGKWRMPWNVGTGELLLPDNPHVAGTNRTKKRSGYKVLQPVDCFPLQSYLAAIQVSHVDYFSLDVQGPELKILKTLPFDETLTIDIIQVENNLIPEGSLALKQFLLGKNYTLARKYSNEFVFIRNIPAMSK